MSNPLYQMMSNSAPMNNMTGFMNALKNLKKNFSGNPQQQIQNLLNSGKVSQEQYNRAVQTAQNIQRILNTRS